MLSATDYFIDDLVEVKHMEQEVIEVEEDCQVDYKDIQQKKITLKE
jgi:hypothetical protein